MNSAFDPFTLVLLAVAAVVLWKLRAVLGQKTGLERPPVDFSNPANKNTKVPDGPVIEGEIVGETAPAAWSGHAEEGTPLANTLAAMAKKAENFTATNFVAGAAQAYEMILDAFATGNKPALKLLLAKDVYESFAGAIDERAKNRYVMTFQFVSCKTARIADANLLANKAAIKMVFVADVIGATHDAEGKLIDGEPKSIREISDQWTFERDLNAKDPNWRLIATGEYA